MSEHNMDTHAHIISLIQEWKETYSKVTWGVLTAVIGLVTATVYKMIIEG